MVRSVRGVGRTIIFLQRGTKLGDSHANPAIVIQMVIFRLRYNHTVLFLFIIIGSLSLQCSPEGQCSCKPGVSGIKCNQCAPEYWKFPSADQPGCQACQCFPEGSPGNTPDCETLNGSCKCKENVEGARCEKCKPGHFQIEGENELGCTPCFCFDHTDQCKMAAGYIKSKFIDMHSPIF